MTRSGRQKLLRILLLLIIVLALIFAGFSLVYLPRIRRQSLSELMHNKTAQSMDRLRPLILPAVTNLELLKELGEQGIFDLSNETHLGKILVPLLDAHLPHVSGFMLADTDGNEYNLFKIDGAWSGRPHDQDYDPRKSPWFRGAIDVIHSNEVFWTPVYSFPASDHPGITASISYQPGSSTEKTFVVALKIALKEIEALIDTLPLGSAGRILLVEDDFVRDFTRLKETDWRQSDVSTLTSLSLLKEPDVAAGLSRWQTSGSPYSLPLFFRSQNQGWWIEVNLIVLNESGEAQFAVLLKDSLLQAETSRFVFILLFSLLAVFVIVLGFVLVLLRRYSRETEAILDKRRYSDASEDQVRKLIEQGESDELEFKSTLRWNLKTNTPDKNVSLASLKTIAAFLNSEGGTLLIGIADGGEVLGIDLQNFANEDKYLLHFNNLLKEHIGLEFSQHISFALSSIGDKQILVVDCEPSEEPVFLKHNSEEEFYIRVGPGTRKLAISKVLDYLKSRDLSSY